MKILITNGIFKCKCGEISAFDNVEKLTCRKCGKKYELEIIEKNDNEK